VSVRGGGHDWAGRALRDGGMVIDLTLMCSVTVAGELATVGGGTSSLDLMTTVERSGLVTAAGSWGAVGYAGLATGGGYGPLLGRYGLAADNLLGAEVVLANGDLVVADATHEPELFWALRGGGGNFGVITSLTVRLHPQESFRSGAVVFPWQQAEDVLRGYAELVVEAPDALTASVGVTSAPDGGRVLFVAPSWSGDPGTGAVILERVVALGTPVANTVSDTSLAAVMRGNDALTPRGPWAVGTRNVAGLTTELIATLIELGETSAPGQTLSVQYFHGAASRVPLANSAFGIRREHFMIQGIARGAEAGGSEHRAWARHATDVLASQALPGGYANVLSPDSHEQIAHAYGPNTKRLLAAKAFFDPTDTFAAIPLPAPNADSSAE
jgi:hypothetical protein